MRAWRPPPPLYQFVLLSMLLHALLIALFGAPSGGSREGRAMWGSMSVELRGLLIESGRAPFAAPRLESHEPQPAEAPPAPARQDRGPAEGAVPLTRPAETQAAASAPLGPAIVEVPAPFPRLLDRLVRPETKLVDPPVLRVPPPTEGRDLRPPPRERPAPSPAAIPAPLPVTPTRSQERILADPPPIPLPLATPAPALPAPVPAPSAQTPAPAQPREAQGAPVEVRAVPVPALESAARIEAPAPVEMAPLPEVHAAPAQPPPVERATPRAAEPAPAAPAVPAVPEPAFPRATAPPLLRPSPVPGEGRREDSRRQEDAYDPTAPALDLDAVRRRAGQIAREGSGQRAVLPFPMPPVPEKKSKLETAIDNARKPDCRTAYQGLGLAAIVPLVANEFGEGTCRW